MLTCVQLLYTTPSRKWYTGVSKEFELCDTAYIGFTEETETELEGRYKGIRFTARVSVLQQRASGNRNRDLSCHTTPLDPNMSQDFLRRKLRRCGEKAGTELYILPRIVEHCKQIGGGRKEMRAYPYAFDLPRKRAMNELSLLSVGGKSMCMDCRRRSAAYEVEQNKSSWQPAQLTSYPMMETVDKEMKLVRLECES